MAQKFLTNFTPPGSNESYKFRAGSLFYGETSNSTTAMSVSIPGVTEYYTGLTLILKMGAQAAANCTLNVNGLGAKKMIYGSSSTGTYFASGATYLFVYDGTQFKAIHSYNNDTTYSVATESANGLLSKEDKIKLNNTNIAYGTCSTAAATAAKVITLNGNTQWALKNGSLIMVKFANSNTASNVTLNVNGTGAYPIWYNNAAYTSTSSAYCGYKNRTITYMFNGTHWVWISSSYDANTQSNTNSTNTDSKIFIIGATSQGSNKTTYSHDTAYVGTDGCLYSNNIKVSVEGHTHNYAGSSSAGGAANSVKTNLIIKLNGGTTEGTNLFTFNGSTAKTINITPAAIGAAAASHGTHVNYGTTASAVNTAASAGTATTVSRSDHVHSLDKATVVAALGYTPPTTNTTYSAGAGLTLDGTTFKHSNSVTAATASGSATKTLTFGGTFALPTVSYDAQGHVTGSGTTTMTMPSDRLFQTLVPTGTAIPKDADLNTTTYLKVGRYYCSANVNATTLKNCPSSYAFMMEVYSPLSTTIDNETTATYVYRLRKITPYNSAVSYIQSCSSGSTANSWTYGTWKVVPFSSFTIDSADKNGGSAQIGATTKPVYINTSGEIVPISYTIAKSVPSDAKFTDTTYGVATSTKLGLIKSGTDILVDSSGNVEVPKLTTNELGSDGSTHDLNILYESGKYLFYNLSSNGTYLNLPNGVTTPGTRIGLLSYPISSTAFAQEALIGEKKYFRISTNGTHVTPIPWADWKIMPSIEYGTAIGSTTQPIYINSSGEVSAINYTIAKSVPSNAKFTDTTYSVATSTANGLVPMFDAADGTIDNSSNDWVLTNNNGSIGWYKLPANAFKNDNTNYYHTPSYTTGLKVATGSGVGDLYVPAGTTSSLGVVKQHTATNCTTYTSDDGATTPAAVKKAFTLFGAKNGIFYVAGNTSGTAGTWTGSNTDIPELFTGLTIAYKIGIAGGSSSTTLNLTTAAGASGAKTVYRNASTAVTTQYPVNAIIVLTYDGSAWKHADYNTNTTYSSMSISEGTTGTATTSRVLTAANLKGIINAHAPTKTGTGATGTWGISITGNAATATKVANALSINGKSYNGSAAIDAGTIGLAYGGTGATTAINARVNLISIGNNPITKPEDDTVANWGAYGPCATAFYSATGQLTNQPSQWGFVHNIMTTTGTEVHQLWTTQAGGDIYHRGGNASGWATNWKKLLDSFNYNSYSPTLTGGGASGTWGISITGNSSTATKLKTARTIQTNLASTTAASFDGSTNITPGVTGVLGAANGGTGVSSHTANRLVWSASATQIQAGYHYANNTKVAINSTSEPSTNFYVNGTSAFNGDVSLNADNSDRYLTFNYTGGTGYNWRIGYLGSGAGEANYLVFQSNKEDGASYQNALRFGLTSLDAAFGGNVYPLTDNTKTLGTSSLKWNNVYATTFTGALNGNAATADKLNSSAGSATKAIYFSGGKPVQCNNTIAHSITGSAASVSSKFSADTSKYNQAITWYDSDGTTQHSYIGAHNTGNTNGAIIINPVQDSTKDNWSSNQGLYIGKTALKFWGSDIVTCEVVDTPPGVTTSTLYVAKSGDTMTGNLTAPKFIGALQGNADTATKANTLSTARTISLTGDVTGSVSFNGSQNVTLTAAVADNSHNHSQMVNFTLGTGGTAPYIYNENGKLCARVSPDGSSYNYAWINTDGSIQATKVYGAVWNDYAEYRICNENFIPGQVVLENGDDTLSIASQRLQRGCSIISDTFGFAIGETDEAKCPVAVSGRVLAYGYESREEFKKHIGWPVCSGPNGTVSIMTEEEEEKYPSRIIGTISAVPDYEEWGSGNIKVNNRVWIKIK